MNLGPDALFNSNLGADVAVYYLKWLDKYWAGHKDKVRMVLSSYNRGPTDTTRLGIATNYCELIFKEMRK